MNQPGLPFAPPSQRPAIGADTGNVACTSLVRLDETWVRFENQARWIATNEGSDVVDVLNQVEEAVEQGLFAVGFVAYEAAAALDPVLRTKTAVDDLPLVGFALFERATVEDATLEGLSSMESEACFEVAECEDEGRYLNSISRIHREISEGTVYQVNYTFPLLVNHPSPGTIAADIPKLLLGRLCRAQGGSHACLLTAGPLQIVSASPELFFELAGHRIVTKPMKGTAPRGRFLHEDQALLRGLQGNQKDRAENLMIVDMMRNDLGRIAKVGTVEVQSLFDVETLPTLHQMTSTVTAETDAGLSEIFSAMFPCASITGAPKVTAMDTIRRLEAGARGVYTGAVGVVLPCPPEALSSRSGRSATRPQRPGARYARFNVGIRTAWRLRPDEPFHYGVGSGVVWDSDPEQEYRECRSKGQAIHKRQPDFRLLETMLLRPETALRGTALEQRIWLFEQHRQRLVAAARYFGFALDFDDVLERLRAAIDPLPTTKERRRLRVLLAADGGVEVQVSAEAADQRPVWRVALAKEPVDHRDPFLFHKTTNRSVYTTALDQARSETPQLDDVILWNETGRLTESCFANLVLPPLETGEPWRTPPRTDGLLDGTLRRSLLDRGRLVETSLGPEDLAAANNPLLINSVRGLIRIRLID